MVYFVDLDGTILKHGTNEPLPGAIDWLNGLVSEGHQIVYVTRRGEEFDPHPVYGYQGLREGIKTLGIPPKAVISDCGSPRVLVNDEECSVIQRETNQAWTAEQI